MAEVLQSVMWCHEIIIVDMESTDASLSIATNFGCKIITHKNIGFADPARQFGLDQTSYEWVLAIDSDEIVPKNLAERLMKIVSNNEADVVELCFRNFFFGQELYGSGWNYRNLKVFRFFKKGFLSYGKMVHSFIEIDQKARKLSLIDYNLAIIHFNYLDVSHFIQKLDRYTSFESQKSRALHPILAGLYQVVRELGGRFIILGGWKDGWIGFYLSFAMSFYRITALTKQMTPNREAIVARYKKTASETSIFKNEEKL